MGSVIIRVNRVNNRKGRTMLMNDEDRVRFYYDAQDSLSEEELDAERQAKEDYEDRENDVPRREL